MALEPHPIRALASSACRTKDSSARELSLPAAEWTRLCRTGQGLVTRVSNILAGNGVIDKPQGGLFCTLPVRPSQGALISHDRCLATGCGTARWHVLRTLITMPSGDFGEPSMSAHRGLHPGVINALAAAVLFGASLPLAKELLRGIAPVLLAGLFYIGSGAVLYSIYTLRRLLLGNKTPHEPGVTRADLPWFAAAIGLGGILAPALLMTGLRVTGAATTSLFLNLEGAFTALLAWFAFQENFDRRIALGMLAIVIAGALLAWPVDGLAHNDVIGSLAIVGACLAWAVDNNLTRKVSAANPLQIAGAKGLVAGTINIGIGLFMGSVLPDHSHIAGAALAGAAGYAPESCSLRSGTAPDRCGAHRCILFAGAVYRRSHLDRFPA